MTPEVRKSPNYSKPFEKLAEKRTRGKADTEAFMLGGSSDRGAKNLRRKTRLPRPTAFISQTAAANIKSAAFFAVLLGLPLNRFVTIHWDAARVEGDRAALSRYLKLASDWIRSRGGQPAFVWVRENGTFKGRHVHILMHLTPDLARGYNRRQRGWLKSCGATWRRGTIKSDPIGQSLSHGLDGGKDYDDNLARSVDYLLKGSDEPARASLGIERHEYGGLVIGKRCGTSQNLGAKARAVKV